jgi:hypothetical protein
MTIDPIYDVPTAISLEDEVQVTDLEFKIIGLSDEDQIIVLVDDHQYGACSYAIKEREQSGIEGGVQIDCDFLQAEDTPPVPKERQDAVVRAIFASLMDVESPVVEA